MGLTEEQRTTLIQLQKEKSGISLNLADFAYSKGFWGETAARMYYAAFHIVAALYIKDGVQCHHHETMVRQFGERYAIKGVVPREMGRIFHQLEQLRKKADYDLHTRVSREEVDEIMPQARELIAAVGKLVDADL